ncbi:MAG: Gfo/Idh/MocA family oxidoreductase [Acidobacteria bacterium]|nr:MAG: Gfo/Idh/MocA family oxidoreductase [Acidobacteriota bacterium]
MEQVCVGLIGCGLFGQSHLMAYRGVHSAEVVAVFDTAYATAVDTAREFGIPRVCSSIEELCNLPEVHAVDVVTPEHAHRQPVIAALERGKAVFVEKPLASSLDDCDAMIQAAGRVNGILMVGHILRFETRYALLKQEVDSGRLGKVISMYARRNRPKSLLGKYGRSHPAIINAIHDIDLMLWYTGDNVRRVRGYTRSHGGGPNPDTFWGVLEFTGGALGVVEVQWRLSDRAGVMLDDAFQLVGERGVGNLSLFPACFSLWRDDGFVIPDVSYDPRVRESARGALRDELEYFCDCVRERRQPGIVTPREARVAVRAALALIESAEAGRDFEIDD